MSKSIKTRLVCVAAAAALLTGCKTVGPDFVAPAAATVQSPASYAMSGDAAPQRATIMNPETHAAGPWWTALGSPVLDQTIRQALTDSPSVAEAAATLQRAQADLAVTRGGEGLQSQFNAGAERERINLAAFGFSGFPGLPAIASPTIDLYSIGGSVSYDLDLFGGQRRAREEGDAKVNAEARRADAAYLSLSGNVAMQAVRIAGYRAQLDTVNDIIQSDQRQINIIRKAQDAGGAAPSEATVGEAQLALDQALLPPIRRDLAAARHQMAILVGKAPGDWVAPDFDLASFTSPAALPIELPSSLIRVRPDIQAAEDDMHAATARIGVTTAALYPDIRLNAGLTQSALSPSDLFKSDFSGWNIGPSISLPLFDRAAKARKEQAVADAKLSTARYQGAVLRAFGQVADALSNLGQDQASTISLTRAVTTNQQAVRDAQTAYDLGGGPLLAVVDAGRQLTQAQRQLVQVQSQTLTDLIQLYTATGGNWRS
jgi:NodT family efflux transporter outer membrane factor (OMF) lipoprotein